MALFGNYKVNYLYEFTIHICQLLQVTNVNYICVTFVTKLFAMKERLIQLLDLEQLTPSKFADIIGVQRSSVSHVISGRNNPSFDFIQKTLRAFPGLHAEWLILGEGSMYEQMGRATSGNLFEPPLDPDMGLFPADFPPVGTENDLSKAPQEPEMDDNLVRSDAESANNQKVPSEGAFLTESSARKVVQVMIFYNDDTFRSYAPAQ